VNGCYKLLKGDHSWDNAGFLCELLHNHSHLAIISSAAEQDALEALINSADRQCHFLSALQALQHRCEIVGAISWPFGVVVTSSVAQTRLLYVEPVYYRDGWPSSGRLPCQLGQLSVASLRGPQIK